MRLPISTYRVQLSGEFPLEELQKHIDYLQDLGISTIYASPIFSARKGSTHGYDVLDPYTINKEIGTLQNFRKLSELLKSKDMNWLQDIVPNHMAFSPNNPWLRDLFELGPLSKYYRFFDINWEESGQVMAPFLGAPLEEVLQQGAIEIQYDQQGFSLNYFEHSYPASARSYESFLRSEDLKTWKEKFSNFSGGELEWEDLKLGFYAEVQENQELRKSFLSGLERMNASPEEVKAILELQYFLPVYWKETENKINYRRFFTINDLICLRMEDPEVFESYHHFLKELLEQGMINSLRIDHIDGLFDPLGYLQDLRKLVGEDTFVIVEKIQESEEDLPEEWPIQGSSGYDFLALVNQVFTDEKGREEFAEGYTKICPEVTDYEDLVFEKKLFILKQRMGGELNNLWELIREKELLGEFGAEKAREALAAFLSAFPVYRIYPKTFPLSPAEEERIQAAYHKALQHLPESKEELEKLKSLFLGKSSKNPEDMLYFLQRCQQFTGPLAAKGVEDTIFYSYNKLISHNEVGDSANKFGVGIQEFHQKMLQRQQNFPHSINASATHDTKRGEDARMRLNVLSEVPQEWFQKLREWQETNADLKTEPQIPDANEEYFIYQTLIGGFPFKEEDDFLERVNAYLQKALREAKVHSTWAEPDETYEKAVFDFVKAILSNEKFRVSFDPFQREIASYGALKSLGQCLIKFTAPGIPDIYQGTEFWDLSFVDPDNRRPVDYFRRKKFLEEFKKEDVSIMEKLKLLKTNFSQGDLKLFTLSRTLNFRREHWELFETGDYLPLELKGKHAENFLAFARSSRADWVLILVPVLVTEIFNPITLGPEEHALEDTLLILPKEAPKKWINIFSGKKVFAEAGIAIYRELADFPVLLLQNS